MREHIFEREGCPLHTWVTGPEGRPLVVFTHGATLDHHSWEPQMPAIAEHYRVLTWDVRGHGLSRPIGAGFSIRRCVDDLLAILDDVGAEQVTLVGLSMGGNISQEVVFQRPERVVALVAMDCACNTLERSGFDLWQVRRVLPAMIGLSPYAWFLRRAAFASSLEPEVRVSVHQASSVLSKDEFVAVFAEMGACLHHEPWYSSVKPTLLMHGDHDKLGSIRTDMPRWAARDPGSRLVIVPDAGHCANQDNPAFVNRELLSFLQEHVG